MAFECTLGAFLVQLFWSENALCSKTILHLIPGFILTYVEYAPLFGFWALMSKELKV